ERVDVRGIGMIEPRCQLRFSQESLHDHVVAAQPLMQDLDDGFAPQKRLLAAVHRAEPARADLLTKDELADRPSRELLAIRHGCMFATVHVDGHPGASPWSTP